jgi:prepilin-type N-terminal cleavage/methylation domain-containing protein
MFTKLQKRMKGDKGFTLIELLVVIIIIAILAAIAIPTFLGQRQKAQDAAAKSLVRNAMTAVESAYVDTRDFTLVTADMLTAIEPSITFVVADGAGAAAGPTAEAKSDSVDVGLVADDEYEVGSVSESEKTFGVNVNKGADGGNTFYIGADVATW